jgi:hypothetical protein
MIINCLETLRKIGQFPLLNSKNWAKTGANSIYQKDAVVDNLSLESNSFAHRMIPLESNQKRDFQHHCESWQQWDHLTHGGLILKKEIDKYGHWINVCCKWFEKSNFCGESRFSLDVLRISFIFSELLNGNQSRNPMKYEGNCMDPLILIASSLLFFWIYQNLLAPFWPFEWREFRNNLLLRNK